MNTDWLANDTAQSHFVPSRTEPGLGLHVRFHAKTDRHRPVLFVHGATFSSRLFDIPHPGASWLKSCEDGGNSAYAIDLRGYGKSQSTVMGEVLEPYARAEDVIGDIDDVVNWILERHNCKKINLVGGSWGSITTSLYVSGLGHDKVDKLILYAPIFAAVNSGWIDLLADPNDRKQFNPKTGAFRLVNESELRTRWDSETLIPNTQEWRDEDTFKALVGSALHDDPLSTTRSPPAFRVPNGTLRDLWSCFNGEPLYDPQAIICPTLLIRGAADPTSTRADSLALFDALAAPIKRYIEIANGAHFISSERNAWQVFAEANAFLKSSSLE